MPPAELEAGELALDEALRPRAVRARRGAKEGGVDPFRPVGWVVEEERVPGSRAGALHRWLTVFTAGAECPFACVFCDLWRFTLDGPTPAGAVPAQLEAALHEAAAAAAAGTRRGALPFDGLKIYNASNLFEPRAVPEADDPRLIEIGARFGRVLVECHPRWLGRRAFRFAAALAERGTRLEVAVGLETVHPEAMARLGKGATIEGFDRAAETLLEAGCGVRAFVLVGAPFQPPDEAVDWAVRSSVHAARRGAEHVSLIPVRGGNGTLEILAAQGLWRPTRLGELEAALDRSLEEIDGEGLPTVVAADTWDLDRFARCPACAAARTARLERIGRSGAVEPRVSCAECGGV